MANNTTLPGTGDVIADEDIGGVKYQLVKLVDGTAAGTGRVAGSAGNGLAVDVTRIAAGTNEVGGVTARGLLVTPVATNITAATPANTAAYDVSKAGNVSFFVKNTVAGTAYVGNPVVVFEQSDDSTSWGLLQVQRSSDGVIGSTFTIPAVGANGEAIFEAAVESVLWVRARVTTAQTTNGMTVVIAGGGMPFSPIVSTMPQPTGTAGAQTSVAATVTTNTTLIAADPTRKGLLVYNESTSSLFVLLGAGTESATVYSLQLTPNQLYEVPLNYCTLRVSGHWVTANGSARITAVT